MKVSKISTQIEFSSPINEWLNWVFMYIRSCSLKEVSLNDACFMFQFQKIWLNREVHYCVLLSAFKMKLLAKDIVLKAFVLRIEKHYPLPSTDFPDRGRAKHMEMRMHNTWMPNEIRPASYCWFLSSANIRSQN